MSEYKFITQVGDCNPFEHGGMFIFEDSSENFLILEVDNIQGQVGGREEPNEHATWLDTFYLWKSDLKRNKKEIIRESGLDKDWFKGESGKVKVIALAEIAVRSRFSDREEPTRRFPTFSETAKEILTYDPGNEKLQEILESYLTEDELGWWIECHLDDVVDGYLEAALFFSSDPNSDTGEELDSKFGVDSFTEEAITQATYDCKCFLEMCDYEDLVYGADQNSYEHIGHDFWLTRNGLGAGLWDGDYQPCELGRRLTEHAKQFNEVHVWPDEEELTLSFE